MCEKRIRKRPRQSLGRPRDETNLGVLPTQDDDPPADRRTQSLIVVARPAYPRTSALSLNHGACWKALLVDAAPQLLEACSLETGQMKRVFACAHGFWSPSVVIMQQSA